MCKLGRKNSSRAYRDYSGNVLVASLSSGQVGSGTADHHVSEACPQYATVFFEGVVYLLRFKNVNTLRKSPSISDTCMHRWRDTWRAAAEQPRHGHRADSDPGQLPGDWRCPGLLLLHGSDAACGAGAADICRRASLHAALLDHGPHEQQVSPALPLS